MRIYMVLLVLLVVLSVSCTTSAIPTKQPIPSRPVIRGQISGLSNGEAVTMRVRTLAEQEVLWGKQLGNGPWEVVITEAGGVDYFVTAEVDGYVSEPVSYTIHIIGDTAYVVRDGQVTDEEAIHLDFHFTPKDSP